MQRQKHKTSRNMKNQEHKTPLKDDNNLSGTDSKEMEICDLPDKEFKIAILRKLNELQENTDRQFNKIRKTIHE